MATVFDNKEMSPWKLLAQQLETLRLALLPKHPQSARASSYTLPANHNTLHRTMLKQTGIKMRERLLGLQCCLY